MVNLKSIYLIFLLLINTNIYIFIGKSIQNNRKNINCYIVNNKRKFQKLTQRPNYLSSKIISEDCVILTETPSTVRLDRPYGVGFVVLGIIKIFFMII